ncbi:hypothetical protein VitviT2T_023360 [Vitis vinifera]|uniref:Uncharacterized protein n=1 Tax=Vitis vinifera TaxID=29760 RepID=A0ABY9DDC8_VITVI|nr:hypothetical protein VitviT2T_023360 [Vitis vinifera]
MAKGPWGTKASEVDGAHDGQGGLDWLFPKLGWCVLGRLGFSLNSDLPQSNPLDIIPITTRLSGCHSSLHEVLKNKDSISKYISGLFDEVYGVIFKDILEERGLEADNNTYDAAHDIETAAKVERKWIRPLKEGTNQQGGAAVPPGLSPVNGTPDVAIRAGSKLNPFAKEWNPWQERAPEEDRSLFITFSNGYPLSNFQIWQFFTTLVLKPQANLLFPSGSTYVYKGALTQNSTL